MGTRTGYTAGSGLHWQLLSLLLILGMPVVTQAQENSSQAGNLNLSPHIEILTGHISTKGNATIAGPAFSIYRVSYPAGSTRASILPYFLLDRQSGCTYGLTKPENTVETPQTFTAKLMHTTSPRTPAQLEQIEANHRAGRLTTEMWPYQAGCNYTTSGIGIQPLHNEGKLVLSQSDSGDIVFSLIRQNRWLSSGEELLGTGALSRLSNVDSFLPAPVKPITPATPASTISSRESRRERCHALVQDRLVTCSVSSGRCDIGGCGYETDCDKGFYGRDCEYRLNTSADGYGTYYCDTSNSYNYSEDLDTVVARICQSL